MQICKHREREMLAVVFGAERFCTYVYGQSFTIESVHKPLESISRKNLADMPTWLQCMMLCLQGYDLSIHYCPGKEMVIPDTFSQFSPQPGIHHAHIMPDHKEVFQQAFLSNPEMQALADLIISGWPEDIKEVPCPLCLYWQHRETLTIEDGLVLQGEALVIPPADLLYQCQLRTTILAKIYKNDPSSRQVCEEIDTCSEVTKSQADKHSKTPVPLYACQPVAMFKTIRKIWVPATVIHVLPWNSYQVCTSNGSTYCCMQRHLHECNVKVVNTVPSGTTATTQAPTRHHFSAAQPALPQPAQCMQPTPTAPATQMNQAPAILPHQLFKGIPQHQCPWHPMPHLCSHKDQAMPTWHQDAWSRKSKNSQPRLSTDLVIVMWHCLHPQSFFRVKL